MVSVRGVSLLELIVVLAIIGILLGIGYALLRPNPARHAAIALASELTAARLQALAAGMPVAVLLSTDRRTVFRKAGAVGEDADQVCASGAVAHRLDWGRFPRVELTSGLERGIVWFPTGWGRACGGGGVYNDRIELAGPAARYAVVVSSAGRVRWEAVR